jgi:corrinoid protein of di/trimethylamine methyltransferase
MVTNMSEEILERLKNSVILGDEKTAKLSAEEYINSGEDPLKAIKTLSLGMKTVGEKFAKEECFIPDLLLAADAMKIGLDLIKPHIKTEKLKKPKRYVIGTVQGDIHDIGKNFVSFMLMSAGFEIFDLGIDVPPRTFAEKAVDVNADIVGSSAFMTTTIQYQKDIEEELKKIGIRDQVKTMVGGVATDERFAASMGADSWAIDAFEAVKKSDELCGFGVVEEAETYKASEGALKYYRKK